MSSHPVKLFRQSLTQTLLLTLGLMFLGHSLGLIQGLTEPPNEWGYQRFDLIRWGMGGLSGSLIATLLALSLPWLLLSWFGEYFYTRSFKRQDVFALFWREFLKFWAPLSLLLLGLCSASQWFKYDSGHEIPWELALFIPALSLLMALLFVANGELLRKLISPGMLLLVWLLTGDGWGFQGWPLGHSLTLLAGAALLFWLYRQLAQGIGELSLEVPGRVDDEYKALERSWLFRSLNWLGTHSPLMLTPSKGSSAIARLKLLSGHPYMLYLQLLAAVGLVGFLISLFLGRAALQNLPMVTTLWILACVLAGICLLLLPVRFAGQSYWEFFRSRPLPSTWQYGVNWGVQSLFLLGLAGLGYILLWSVPEVAVTLNLQNVGLSLLFLWLAGELGAGLLLLLLAFGFSTSPTLVPAVGILLHSTDWPALALWGCALAFRAWDFWRFQSTYWEPLALPRQRFLRQLGHYLPPALCGLGVIFAGLQTQPLAGFVALNIGGGKFQVGAREQPYLAYKALEVLYAQNGKRFNSADPQDPWSASYEEMSLLRELLKAPHDTELAKKLAERLLRSAIAPNDESRVYIPQNKDHYQREYAHYYLTQGNYWLRFTPKSGNSPYLRALMAEAQGNFVAAQVENAKALQTQPIRFEWLMQKARLQTYLLRYAAALETYTAMATQFPEKSSLAWRGAQNIALESGQWEKALEYALRSLQAGYRPGNRSSYRALDPDWILSALSDYHMGLCPRLNGLLQTYQRQSVGVAWLPQLANQIEWNCSRRDKQLAKPHNFVRGSRNDGLWLLEHGHPALAAEAFSGHDNRGLKAEALWQAGKTSAALALAREAATPWQTHYETVYYYPLHEVLFSEGQSPEYLGHRVLLKAGQPRGLDSGYQVLLTGTRPQQDWPLVQKAYGRAPEQWQQLQRVYRAYNTLAKAFAETGMTGIEERRSMKKLQMMLFMADTLPTELQTAELKGALQTLRKVLYR